MGKVVITGLGTVNPVGLDTSSSWQNIIRGASGVKKIASYETLNLQCKIAAIIEKFAPENILTPKEIRSLPRFIQLALVASHEALKDSELEENNYNNRQRLGCIIGVGLGSLELITNNYDVAKNKGYRRVSPFFIPYSIANMAAGIVATKYNLQGPNLCTTTACSSGSHAIGEAWLQIKAGLADAILCGGAESSMSPLCIAGFDKMRALSRRNDDPQAASRPFDRDRDGFVMGEGSGVMILECEEHAKARGAKIYAELAGYGASCDAYHITSLPPNGQGASNCMRIALKSAQLNIDDIDYINAHGTSTQMNDATETQAIHTVFGYHAKNLSISSTKGATGHCLGGAGGIEGVLTTKAVVEGIIPPTNNLHHPCQKCDLNYTPLKAQKRHVSSALSNSFGFGGTNASLVIRKYQL